MRCGISWISSITAWPDCFTRLGKSTGLPSPMNAEKTTASRGILMDLIGLGTAGLEKRLGVRDDSLLYYSGLLVAAYASRLGAGAHAGGLFRCACGDPAVRWRLAPPGASPINAAWAWIRERRSNWVGGAIAGDQIWDQQSGARIKLGPLTLERVSGFPALRYRACAAEVAGQFHRGAARSTSTCS